MWHRPEQVGAGDDSASLLGDDLAGNREVQLDVACESQVSATLPLTQPLAVADQGSRRHAEREAAKAHHDIVAFVGLDPESVGREVVMPGGCLAREALDEALYRASGRVRPHGVDAYDDSVCFSLQRTFVNRVYPDNGSIDGDSTRKAAAGNGSQMCGM